MDVGRMWFNFRKNPISLVGLSIVVIVILLAALAPYIVPYPEHLGAFVDFATGVTPPSWKHPFGTDTIGRDILSRTIYGYRFSLTLGIAVLSIAVPFGTILGLFAAYSGGWVESLIMRATDVFLSIPPLVLALAVITVLRPNLMNAMLAVSLMWWPWYSRLAYTIACSIKEEYYIVAAKVMGAKAFHMCIKEILPNCLSSLLTKITIDMGFVILMGASLSFLGLGVQAPKPGLGTMVADGVKFMPTLWWISIFPGLAIVLVILGFNLLGDGLRDIFDVEV